MAMRIAMASIKRGWHYARMAPHRGIGGMAMADAGGPTVAEMLVRVVLVDLHGRRHDLVGRVGQTLVEACQMTADPMVRDDSFGGGAPYEVVRNEHYTESLYGEGASSPYSHVIVADDWVDKLPKPNTPELRALSHLPEEDRKANSRLGTEIVLTKALDGLVLVVPESPPIETYDYKPGDDDSDDEDEEEER